MVCSRMPFAPGRRITMCSRLCMAIKDLLHSRVVVLMQLVKADRLTAGCAVQFHRKRQQSKGKMSLPYGTGHSIFSKSWGEVMYLAQNPVQYNLRNSPCH